MKQILMKKYVSMNNILKEREEELLRKKYWIYIVSYIIVAIVLIIMQHTVWHLSANAYLVVMISYFTLAFFVRYLIKK